MSAKSLQIAKRPPRVGQLVLLGAGAVVLALLSAVGGADGTGSAARALDAAPPSGPAPTQPQPAVEAATLPASQPATEPAVMPASAADSQPASQVLDERPAGRPLLLGGTGGGSLGTRSDVDTGKMLWQTLAYLVVLALLGGLAVFALRRLSPRLKSAGGGRGLAIAETVHIGPRKTVHVLQVGSRRILIASSRDEIAMLADVTDAYPAPAQEPGKKQQ
jgi:flagellar biogenesis protein FliO